MERLRRLEVFGADGCAASAARHRVDGSVAQHSHDFLEIVLVLGGNGRHLGSAGAVGLQPGMLLAIRPGQLHGYDQCVRADLFNLYVGAELCRRELLWALDFPDLARFLLRGGISPSRLDGSSTQALLGWLTTLARRQDPAGTPEAAVSLGLVSCAVGEMGPAFRTVHGAGSASPSISPLVRRALTCMSEEPERAWTMPVLAQRLAVSVAHLHRRFGTEMGVPPMRWLASTRMELAASLLIGGDASISAIGRAVGWPDPGHFSRRFRELSGSSPREYRLRAGAGTGGAGS